MFNLMHANIILGVFAFLFVVFVVVFICGNERSPRFRQLTRNCFPKVTLWSNKPKVSTTAQQNSSDNDYIDNALQPLLCNSSFPSTAGHSISVNLSGAVSRAQQVDNVANSNPLNSEDSQVLYDRMFQVSERRSTGIAVYEANDDDNTLI